MAERDSNAAEQEFASEFAELEAAEKDPSALVATAEDLITTIPGAIAAGREVKITVNGDVLQFLSEDGRELYTALQERIRMGERQLIAALVAKNVSGVVMAIQILRQLKANKNLTHWLLDYGYSLKESDHEIQLTFPVEGVPGLQGCAGATFTIHVAGLTGRVRLAVLQYAVGSLDRRIVVSEDKSFLHDVIERITVVLDSVDSNVAIGTLADRTVNVALQPNDVVDGELTPKAYAHAKITTIVEVHNRITRDCMSLVDKLPVLTYTVPEGVSIVDHAAGKLVGASSKSAVTAKASDKARLSREGDKTWDLNTIQFTSNQVHLQLSSQYKWEEIFAELVRLLDGRPVKKVLLVGAGKTAGFVADAVRSFPQAHIYLCDIAHGPFRSSQNLSYFTGEKGNVAGTHVRQLASGCEVVFCDVSQGNKLENGVKTYYRATNENVDLAVSSLELFRNCKAVGVVKFPLGMDSVQIKRFYKKIGELAGDGKSFMMCKPKAHNHEAFLVIYNTPGATQETCLATFILSFKACVDVFAEGVALRQNAFDARLVPNAEWLEHSRGRFKAVRMPYVPTFAGAIGSPRVGGAMTTTTTSEPPPAQIQSPVSTTQQVLNPWGDEPAEEEVQTFSLDGAEPASQEEFFLVGTPNRKGRRGAPHTFSFEKFQAAVRAASKLLDGDMVKRLKHDESLIKAVQSFKICVSYEAFKYVLSCCVAIGVQRPGTVMGRDIWPFLGATLAQVQDLAELTPVNLGVLLRQFVFLYPGFIAKYSAQQGDMALTIQPETMQVTSGLKLLKHDLNRALYIGCLRNEKMQPYFSNWLFKQATFANGDAGQLLEDLYHEVGAKAGTILAKYAKD